MPDTTTLSACDANIFQSISSGQSPELWSNGIKQQTRITSGNEVKISLCKVF